MIERYFDGLIPAPEVVEGPEEELLATIAKASESADRLVLELKVTEALGAVWDIVRHANRYLVEREPWKLARDEAHRALVAGILNTTAEAVRALAVLLVPAMPERMTELWSRLGYEGSPNLDAAPVSGHRVRGGDPLFPRLES
jgi:methionyl-tRNA synthetase